MDPTYIERLESRGLVFSGRHPDQPIMQILELRSVAPALDEGEPEPITHPYFIGAQFHPELTSRPLKPQPMFMGLIAASIRARYASSDPDRWAQMQNEPSLARWLHRPSSAEHRV